MGIGMTRHGNTSPACSAPIRFWEPFDHLVETPEHELTPEELASRRSFEATWADIAGDSTRGAEHRWARMSREIRFFALALGRLPCSGDPDVAPRHLRWIAAQHPDQLNAYQRACVEALPGWRYP